MSKNFKDYLDVIQKYELQEYFNVKTDDGYHLITYAYLPHLAFPKPIGDIDHDMNKELNSELDMIADMRGICFSIKTGEIIRRPLQKFFNVGERTSSQDFLDYIENKIDQENFTINFYTKEDGTMIAPFYDDNDNLIWGTKAGDTDHAKIVKEFMKDKKDYLDFVDYMIKECGKTPIFEYVAPTNRIVLSYDTPKLIYLGCRNIQTGDFYRASKWLKLAYPNIEYVEGNTLADVDLLEFIKDDKNIEGYIVEVESNITKRVYTNLKIKTDWYCNLHRLKDNIQREHDLFSMILSNQTDDLYVLLEEADRTNIQTYETQVLSNIKTLQKNILSFWNDYTSNNKIDQNDRVAKKDFALVALKMNNFVTQCLFELYKYVSMKDDSFFDLYSVIEKITLEGLLAQCQSASKFQQFRKNDIIFANVKEYHTIKILSE